MNRTILSVLLVTALAACGSDAESREDLDSEAAVRDAPAQPATAAPRAPAAAAQPAAPAPAQPAAPATAEPVRAIPSGTLLTFEVRENVSTSSHSSGDGFSLVLVDAVTGPAGALLSAGSQARGVVTESHASSGADDQALLAVRVTSVAAGGSQRPIEGVVESAAVVGDTRDSGARTAATIATGAAAGAIIGQILGRDTRSTVTGAAVGTAVGVGVALTTRGGDATLTEGSRIVFRLDRDLVY